MDTQIVVVFCLCDDLLKSWHHHEDQIIQQIPGMNTLFGCSV